MKDDERNLLFAIHQAGPGGCVRDIANGLSMPYKRALYCLGKWAKRGWYDCGVSLDLGWLTEEGKDHAQALLIEARR